jgi:polyhydroxybutyrate depolymerase
MIINGTADNVNPYAGGMCNVLGVRRLGEVISSRETAAYWARLAGHPGDPEQYIYLKDPRKENTHQNIAARITFWSAKNRKSVVLITVPGGGHNIPYPHSRFPRITGKTCQDIDAYKLVCDFFRDARLPLSYQKTE